MFKLNQWFSCLITRGYMGESCWAPSRCSVASTGDVKLRPKGRRWRLRLSQLASGKTPGKCDESREELVFNLLKPNRSLLKWWRMCLNVSPFDSTLTRSAPFESSWVFPLVAATFLRRRPPHSFERSRTVCRYWSWLVVWNMFYFPMYWEESSQLTNSYCSDGWLNHQPGNVGRTVSGDWFGMVDAPYQFESRISSSHLTSLIYSPDFSGPSSP